MAADASGEDEARRDDSIHWIWRVGIPDAVSDDWAGEVGDRWRQREEPVAVCVVPRCYLREQGVLDLSLLAATVAGDVTHVFVEEHLHAVAHVAIDGGDGHCRSEALAVAGPVLAPFF